jgi:uncharacterized membrane protein
VSRRSLILVFTLIVVLAALAALAVWAPSGVSLVAQSSGNADGGPMRARTRARSTRLSIRSTRTRSGICASCGASRRRPWRHVEE